MDLTRDQDYYITLCARLGKTKQTPYHPGAQYALRLGNYVHRVLQKISEHWCYDANDIEEAEAEDDMPLGRDPDRERSYEDYLESFAPVEHPGDSWKDNEDL